MVVGKTVKAKFKTRIKSNLLLTVSKAVDQDVSWDLWWFARVLLENYIKQTIGRAVLWR